ncbi:DUF1616 domain-containing protein [Halococcus salifodinae]|uniref:DUF1616 domain-containing protein n=1 Tax=Halococcus salifodinae DSM 8989 TaxID=1227456 RepID=M0N447_9EURY|nr:DUF1616 domain-containing protein [Halococcus salifodinae]EMA51884.1 hypothetical protein C450_12003 [Halococcus salifodinae DSM 8989]
MSDGTLRLLLPRFLRRFPADLAAIVLLVLATGVATLAPVISETPLRVVLGLAFALFAPGYAFIAALFPERGPAFGGASASADEDDHSGSNLVEQDGSADANTGLTERVDPRRAGGIDGIERVALSFGLSIAITPLIGLILNFTPFGIRLVPIVLSIGGFTLLASAVAALRRQELPVEERFEVPYRAWVGAARAELFEPETRLDAVLNVVLVVSLLLAVSSVGYAVMVPKSGESFSEFYLLTENESGALVADDYPQNFTVGQGQPLTVGIGNHEHEQVEYSVVAELQRVSIRNNSTTVRERQELDRFSRTVPANESVNWTHDVTPSMTGERLRLVYLLYRGSPPAEPTVENAYRETHLWVNVSSQ